MAFRRLPQGVVTDEVAVLVVEPLEVVQVQHHDAERPPVAPRALPLGVHVGVETAPVRKQGEGVLVRLCPRAALCRCADSSAAAAVASRGRQHLLGGVVGGVVSASSTAVTRPASTRG